MITNVAGVGRSPKVAFFLQKFLSDHGTTCDMLVIDVIQPNKFSLKNESQKTECKTEIGRLARFHSHIKLLSNPNITS